MRNVLSLFDGISCGRLSLDRAGVKYGRYYASEIEKRALKVTQHNYPDTIQLGDVTKVTADMVDGDVFLLMGGSPCFPAGALIMTSLGYKNIEDIETGDYVLTHTNKYQKVVTPMRNKAKVLYAVSTMSSEGIRATEEHPFYVRRKGRVKGNKGFTYSKPEWIKACDLTTEYMAGIAINQNSKLPTWNGLEVNENQFDQTRLLNKLVPLIDKLDFWYIIGRFIGDGWVCTDGKSVELSCTKKTPELLLQITDRLDRLGINYCVVTERTSLKVQIVMKELHVFLSQFGDGASNKHLTDTIFDLPVNHLKSFLDGVLESGGCYTQNKYKITSVSRELVYGLGQCVAKAYHRPYSIYKDERPETHIIEGRTVNQKDTYQLTFRKVASNRDHAFYDAGYIWTPIRKVEKQDYSGWVYNMEVETDNSYTVNNIVVHNCQDLSAYKYDRGDVKGLEGSKSNLFYHFERLFRETKPKYFLFENVPMRKEWEEIISELLGVEPIIINSNLVSAADRKRLYWTNIPGITQPKDKQIYIRDIIVDAKDVPDKYWYDKPFTYHGEYAKVQCTLDIKGHRHMKEVYNINGKCSTLTTCDGGNLQKKVYQDGRCRKFMPIEYERLMNIPDNYTNVVCDTDRYSTIGNGWTVDVIAHILSFLPLEYFL